MAQTGWGGARTLRVNDRCAVAMAIVSGAVLVGLTVAWLAVSTRTALLNRQLDELEWKHTLLTEAINRTWTEIGEATSPQVMEDRAKRLGFRPAERIEYLVTTLDGAPAITMTHSTKP